MPSKEPESRACARFPRDGALMKGVPVVVGPDLGEDSLGSSARNEVDKAPCVPREGSCLPLCNVSAEREYWSLLNVLRIGISLPCAALPSVSPDADPPRFLFNRATAGFVGVLESSVEPRFSPCSSLCFKIFFRKLSQVSLMASLSYSEKGRGGCLRAVELLVAGGGSGESGSSIASGAV